MIHRGMSGEYTGSGFGFGFEVQGFLGLWTF